MVCDTQGLSSGTDWACRSSPSAPWKGVSTEPKYGDECKRFCSNAKPYYQVCNVSDSSLNGYPKMITYSGKACHGEITTAAPTTTTLATTTEEPTLAPEKTTYIEHTVELTLNIGNKSADEILKDTGMMASIKCSLKDGVVAA